MQSAECPDPEPPTLASGDISWRKLSGSLPAKSKADFISKMSTVLEEADESAFWVELQVDASKVPTQVAEPLLAKANELTAIAASSINTAKRNSEQLCSSCFAFTDLKK